MHVSYFEHRHLLSPSLIPSHFYWAPSSQEVPLCVSVSLCLDPLNHWLRVVCMSTGRELFTGACVATQWLQLLIKWPALPQQPLTTKPSSIHDGIVTDLIFYIHVKITELLRFRECNDQVASRCLFTAFLLVLQLTFCLPPLPRCPLDLALEVKIIDMSHIGLSTQQLTQFTSP